MKIFGRNVNFGRKTYEQLRQMIAREKMDYGGNLTLNAQQQMSYYKDWVYDCVTLISDRVCTLPFKFYNKDTGEELSTKNKNYRIFTKPFYNPNPMMTFRFIKQFCQIQLDLCGMAVLLPVKNPFGQVWEIWPLNMADYMKVEVGGTPDNPQVKYFFQSSKGGWIDFDISELIVINYPNVMNPYAPMSPIQAQAYTVDLEKYISIYERDFFKNSARIDFALTTDVPIGQDKADEIKARWKSKYQGVFHDVAVLDSGLKPVQLSFANKDFEFLNLAGWTKEKVLACYRVPSSKLGSPDSNRAGSVQSDISFNRECIGPRLTLWDEELTLGICSTYDERLQFRHENPIPRDRQLEVAEAKTYLAGLPVMTINEYRKEVLNLGPIAGGEKFYIPNKYIDIADVDKVTQANIVAATKPPGGASSNTGGSTRPAPDGSDPRDDNPTEGRSISGQEQVKAVIIESKIRETVTSMMKKVFSKKEDTWDKYQGEVGAVLVTLTDSLAEKLFGITDKLSDEWVVKFSDEVAKTVFETLDKNYKSAAYGAWDGFVNEMFESNPRIAKINNAMIRSAVNFVKYMHYQKNSEPVVWTVNSNECGHKGRILVKRAYGGHFKLGIHNVRFPGEKLSLNCDCELEKGE